MTELSLTDWLDRFDAVAQPAEGVDRTSRHNGGRHSFHVVFGVMVHGNEIGGLPALVELLEDLSTGRLTFGGTLTTFVGNAEAGLADVRFLDADLNRVFVDQTEQGHEHKRARALLPLLEQADLFLDFHQTIEATESAFYTYPWTPLAETWTRAIGEVPVWVTRAPGQSFSPGTRCADEVVRDRGRAGLTVELSQKGLLPDAIALASRLMRRTLALADSARQGLPPDEPARPLPACFETAYIIPFSDPMLALRPGLTNLAPVQEGEVLSSPGAPLLTAPFAGRILFPKYPPRDASGRCVGICPGELVRIIRPLAVVPAPGWPIQSERA